MSSVPVWEAVDATARGSSHVRTGLPNQDAVATTVLDSPQPTLVAAVADGHGGERYVRSDTGSRLAVELAVRVATEWWSTWAHRASADGVSGALANELAPSIVAAWRTAVADDIARRPFTPEEIARGGGPFDADPIVAYGATLLVAIVSGDVVLLAQLGDGDITVVSADGRVDRPIPGDDRLVSGQTTSLCLPTAESDFRVAALGGDSRTEIVLLSTDGYGNSFADSDWYVSVARDLQDLIRVRGVAHVRSKLASWLGDSAEVGGDDVTAAVLARPVSAISPVAPATAPPTSRSSMSPPPGAPSSKASRSAPGALVIVTVALAVLGLLVGFLLGRSTGGESKSSQPSVSSSAASTVSSTSVPTPSSERLRVASRGGVVEFVADVTGPHPVRTSESEAWVTQLLVGGENWAVRDDGRLQVTADGRVRTIDLQQVHAGGLLFDRGIIWVCSDDAGSLVAVQVQGQRVIQTYQVDAGTPAQQSTSTVPGEPGASGG